MSTRPVGPGAVVEVATWRPVEAVGVHGYGHHYRERRAPGGA